MADYKTSQKLSGSAHQDSGLATSDISISSSSPQCFKIYWSITLKDLFVSRQITSFLKNYGMSLFGGGGLTERDMGRGVRNVHFIRDVLNGCSFDVSLHSLDSILDFRVIVLNVIFPFEGYELNMPYYLYVCGIYIVPHQR